MLAAVKDALAKLLNFLTDDFGFSGDDMHLYFSGGRGYHCHVRHDAVLSLDSQQRGEIIDYITGRGLDLRAILREEFDYGGERATLDSQRRPGKKLAIDMAQGGWTRRILAGMVDFYERLATLERVEALRELRAIEGVGPKTARQIYDSVTDGRLKARLDRIRAGNVDQAPAFRRIAPHLAKTLALSLHGEADEPVTTDIKRLIRLPGSLHGKTGLAVTAVSFEGLHEFLPLRDAVVFPDDETTVEVTAPVTLTMMEHTFSLKKGSAVVPEYLAVFLVARGLAVPTSSA
jgi:DNA primase small subunit